MSILNEMAEGIYQRDERKEAARLVSKWEKTGLLEGMAKNRKATMARLLENQAAALLSEASTSGDISGFQNVAFPIVRRVFAGLIANELVSVQPMSLPSGLLFYMDYRFDTVKAGNQLDKATSFAKGGSLFGDQKEPGTENYGTGGFFNLGSSFSQREKISSASYIATFTSATAQDVGWDPDLCAPGTHATATIGNDMFVVSVANVFSAYPSVSQSDMRNAQVGTNELKQWVVVSASSVYTGSVGLGPTGLEGMDGTPVRMGDATVYRRFTVPSGTTGIKFVVASPSASAGTWPAGFAAASGAVKLSYIVGSQLDGGTTGTMVTDAYESDMAVAPSPPIPELDFTIKSVAVTANSRKLKAKWTPELAQDLAAYQNLDAEVELTQVLSEAIALEIDREILGDLLYNATGANFYWSRVPGNFVNKTDGKRATSNSGQTIPFTGTVREWYETLVETVIDVANNIHRKTLRGAANFLVTSPDVATIFEASVLYKPTLSMDPKETMFTVGTEKIGSLSNRFTVYKDPYFPRNKILVGYKGGSFLETGYVYAPYVPLIVTPTIYAPEDFTPRKGVMTRYAKKLVRSDFYGTVTVQDLNVI
jgi:hypothetical protein